MRIGQVCDTLRVMHVIVVSGLPCSGKSKVAQQLGDALRWPLLCKDDYKELLFDTLGHSDRAWSKRVSAAAYALQFSQAAQLAASRVSFILEGNFRWDEHQARFDSLFADAKILQIHCRSDAEVLAQRFRQRAQSGTRHPGHVDSESLDEIERELRSAIQQPLPLPGEVIDCDTSGDWQNAIEIAVSLARQRVS
jgi:predicted kinase